MKKLVKESLYESLNEDDEILDDEIPEEIEDDSDVVVEDEWEKPEEEEELPDEIKSITIEPEEDIEVEDFSDELKDLFDSELEMKEFNRTNFEFKVIPRNGNRGSSPERVEGVPMAKLSNNNYIFKTPDGMRKFNLRDIVLIESKNSKGKILNEDQTYTYENYLTDVASHLLTSPEAVQAILDIHTVDHDEAQTEIIDELRSNDQLYNTKEMFETGVDPDVAANKIIHQYEG